MIRYIFMHYRAGKLPTLLSSVPVERASPYAVNSDMPADRVSNEWAQWRPAASPPCAIPTQPTEVSVMEALQLCLPSHQYSHTCVSRHAVERTRVPNADWILEYRVV